MKLEEFSEVHFLSRRSDVAHGARQTKNMHIIINVTDSKKVCYHGLHSAPRVKCEMHILPIGGRCL